MWHQVQSEVVIQSLDALPANVSSLPPGAILKAGWRQGVESPKPFHNQARETIELHPQYDRYSGIVTEVWSVVPRNSFVLMGDAMLIRREESRQRKLKGRKY